MLLSHSCLASLRTPWSPITVWKPIPVWYPIPVWNTTSNWNLIPSGTPSPVWYPTQWPTLPSCPHPYLALAVPSGPNCPYHQSGSCPCHPHPSPPPPAKAIWPSCPTMTTPSGPPAPPHQIYLLKVPSTQQGKLSFSWFSNVCFNLNSHWFNLTSHAPCENNISHLMWKNSQNNREAALFPSIRYLYESPVRIAW